MVKLVEDLSLLPNQKISCTVAVQYLYAFALNRRNMNGDREKALSVILKVRDLGSFVIKFLSNFLIFFFSNCFKACS